MEEPKTIWINLTWRGGENGGEEKEVEKWENSTSRK